MATTGLPPDTNADIARVTEALAMITPRWNVRILLALADGPLRYTAISNKLPGCATASCTRRCEACARQVYSSAPRTPIGTSSTATPSVRQRCCRSYRLS